MSSKPLLCWGVFKSPMLSAVRMTEFWTRMESALGASYARYWADTHVLGNLGGRTANQALAEGETAKAVWRAVWEALELPPRDR